MIQKIHTYTHKNESNTVKWAQWDKTQARELSGLFICMCTALCTTAAYNTAQNRPDNFPSYPPDIGRQSSLLRWCPFEGRRGPFRTITAKQLIWVRDKTRLLCSPRHQLKTPFVCPWWPWPLTLTFKLVQVRDKRLPQNLAQIRSAVYDIFHTQTKKSQTAPKNRTLCSSLHVVKTKNLRNKVR